ncbi:MAG: head-tail connector protein [Roseburia sp.]|nr:head-tail connector protein [Roseburia sp.]
MYITLKEGKKHLQIDEDFTDDDNYIISLIQVAEDAVAQHLDTALIELIKDGELPSAVKHSILLMVGNLYATREPVAYTSAVKVPYTLDYLLGLYKHYYIP